MKQWKEKRRYVDGDTQKKNAEENAKEEEKKKT